MKIKLWVATNTARSICSKIIEVDDKEWNNFEDYDKDVYMFDELQNAMLIQWGYEEQ